MPRRGRASVLVGLALAAVLGVTMGQTSMRADVYKGMQTLHAHGFLASCTHPRMMGAWRSCTVRPTAPNAATRAHATKAKGLIRLVR